ncbi:alpha/beta hydrolase [Candidatus Latescibacterota bacterium]
MKKIVKLGGAFFLFGTLLMSTVIIWLSGMLAAPSPAEIGMPPVELHAYDVSFHSESGVLIRGWYIPGTVVDAAIVLMHGNGGNRLRMLSRAKFLSDAGYPLLLFDFQAHGESAGSHKTFGYLEKFDAQAAVDFIRNYTSAVKIGIIGTSLGGAATLLCGKDLEIDAAVLEAVYPTIEEAVQNRLHIKLGSIGPYLTNIHLLQMKPRLGFHPDALRPIDFIGAITYPVFIIAGTEDKRTTIKESKALYDGAQQPKEFWAIEGAAHEDFYILKSTEYERKVLSFFSHYLFNE